MKQLKNWDNKTWLSSRKYIESFCFFLIENVKIDKKTKILDIGCGRANIISFLQSKYNFYKKPVGIDIVKNYEVKKNIDFKKTDAIKYLNCTNNFFDLIIIKQTIHFFSKKEVEKILTISKKKLNKNGQILIFSIYEKKNQIPSFKLMRSKLNKSLQKDKILSKQIKKIFKKFSTKSFKFNVAISKKKYFGMLKKRYISCLLSLTNSEIKKGILELDLLYKNKIIFKDILNCIKYKK